MWKLANPQPSYKGTQFRYGSRVPCLVLGPYAKSGYISKMLHSHVSLVKFCESLFGLPTLNQRDAQSDDMSDCFDFGGVPGPITSLINSNPRSPNIVQAFILGIAHGSEGALRMKKTSGSGLIKWNYKADIMTACSCDWGCPCNFNAPPTQGFCEGGWALKIGNGKSGDVRLDGLGFALMAKWPKAIHEGGGTARIWIDSKATKEQRHMLDQIVKGKMGGKPWPIFAPTIDTWLETSFAAFEWQFDGARSHYKFGDQVRLAMEPMRNPVTGNEVPAKIVLPDGITCNELNMTSSEVFSVFAPGLKYAWPGKMAWYGSVQHGL